MKIRTYIEEQLRLHPSLDVPDIVKLCYQSSRGAEHLLSDEKRAWMYLLTEYKQTAPKPNEPLVEFISPEVARINIGRWRAEEMPIEWLFRMFLSSASVKENAEEELIRSLDEARELILQNELNVSLEYWDKFTAEFKKDGMPAIHHSDRYRENEAPSYRIVNGKYARILPILKEISRFTSEGDGCERCRAVIAIDGRCASGKSTMAEELAYITGGEIIHMDDFFLPPELRTEERFSSPAATFMQRDLRTRCFPI